MKQTVNFTNFCDAFRNLRPNNFSYEGLQALFDYLTELEDDTGQEIELDVIALCCDYTEYKDLNEYLNERYTTEEINEKIKEVLDLEDLPEGFEMTEEQRQEFIEAIEQDINDNTILIKIGESLENGFIIQNY